MVLVEVPGRDVEVALKRLKKLMVREGLFKEMKRRTSYEKPSVRRTRKRREVRAKRRRALKRQAAEAPRWAPIDRVRWRPTAGG